MLEGSIAILTIESSIGKKYRNYNKYYAFVEIKIGKYVINFTAKKLVTPQSIMRGNYAYIDFMYATHGAVHNIEKYPEKKINYDTALKFAQGISVPLSPDTIYKFEFSNKDELEKFLISLSQNFKDDSFMRVLEKFVEKI